MFSLFHSRYVLKNLKSHRRLKSSVLQFVFQSIFLNAYRHIFAAYYEGYLISQYVLNAAKLFVAKLNFLLHIKQK